MTTITVRPADLFEAWTTALRGDEFVQRYDDEMVGNNMCVLNVGYLVSHRAGSLFFDIHTRVNAICRQAAFDLGYEGLAEANDSGRFTFAELADALDAARSQVEREAGVPVEAAV